MIGAPEAAASVTSLSVMPPTPAWSTRALMSSFEILLIARDDRLDRALDVALDDEREFDRLLLLQRREHRVEAGRRVGGALACRSRSGDRRRPRGRAPRSRPRSACRRPTARRRGRAPRPAGSARLPSPGGPCRRSSRGPCPRSAPTTKMSPTFSVPRWTSTVASGPRPLSSLASTTAPSAARSGLAFSSSNSAWSAIASSNLSRLVFLSAETSTSWTSPHISSTIDLVLEQLLADLLRIGAGLVDLVDRDDHRHAGRLGVVDRLDRLRLQPVVGRHHQDDDVGDVGAARAHLGEGLVARRVEEGDLRLVGQGRPDRRRYAG